MSNAETPAEPAKKKSKKAILIPVIVLLLGIGGGAFFFVSSSGGKKGAAAGSTTSTTMPGPIVNLNPITLNLTDGHVLKVGLSLELLAKPKDKEMKAVVAGLSAKGEGASASSSTTSPMGGLESKALDLTISEMGSKSFTELSSPTGRASAKDELNKEITEAYEGDVVKIYFTNFVMS